MPGQGSERLRSDIRALRSLSCCGFPVDAPLGKAQGAAQARGCALTFEHGAASLAVGRSACSAAQGLGRSPSGGCAVRVESTAQHHSPAPAGHLPPRALWRGWSQQGTRGRVKNDRRMPWKIQNVGSFFHAVGCFFHAVGSFFHGIYFRRGGGGEKRDAT